MIQVKVQRKDTHIVDILLEGHANSGTHGHDLVCAGVSASATGVLNALEAYGFLQNNEITMEKGYIHITVHETKKEFQVILETLVIILKTIATRNGEFIKISNMEV